MDNLNLLLRKYQKQLYKDGGVEVPGDTDTIDPNVVLMALEEMLGVECGGQYLGDTLEQWLSLPPKKRKPVQFADLKAKWDAEQQEISTMVEKDLANLR
jgi:hypothetical protein